MPRCPKCGKEVYPNAKFCANCGSAIQQTAPSSTSPINQKGSSPKLMLAGMIAMLIIGLAVGRGMAPSAVPRTQTIVQTVTSVIAQTLTTESISGEVHQGEWKTIATFTGINDKDTADFSVQTDYWRIVYTVQPANPYSSFSLYVYHSGQTEGYLAAVLFVKSGTDTTYVRVGSGAFWISVNAANLLSWTIEVQAQQ